MMIEATSGASDASPASRAEGASIEDELEPHP